LQSKYQEILLIAELIVRTASGESVSTSDSSATFGGGIEVSFAQHHGISLELSQLFSGDGYDVTALSLGYRYRH
jgi:outer membrane autotransporter protein